MNIFWVDASNLTLEVDRKQREKLFKANDVFRTNEIYRFDVTVTGKDCPPIKISVRVALEERSGVVNVRLPMPLCVSVIPANEQ